MSDAAPPVGPGMGLDEAREKRLEQAAEGILKALAVESPDYAKVAGQVAAARVDANALLALADKAEPKKVDTPEIPAEVPLVVLDQVKAEQVLAAWAEQLELRVRSVYEMLSGKILKPLPKWDEAIGVGWRHRTDRSKRAKPTAATLREAHAFALLLAADAKPIPVRRGELLLEDDLKKGHEKWHLYGPADTIQTDKGLRRRNRRVRHADSVMWSKKPFDGNILYEIVFIANNGGRAPGVLFPICGRPVKEGTDLSVSAGVTMDAYNFGVHAYHFSIHRGNTNICNGRKVGTGLHLIGSRTPDPAKEVGKAYRVTVGKWGRVVFFLVDGVLQHSYFDAGTFGPPLTAGSLGVRHWGGADATYADVKVYRLTKVAAK